MSKHLKDLENESIYILRAQFQKLALFSVGKDSITVACLA